MSKAPALDVAAQDVAVAGDSLTVAAWTLVSRASGVARVAVIAAVLGPTFFGNAYQFTNSLPNLIYFGLLAGSLFSSLLVPALVEHVDAGDGARAAKVAGGFLGTTLVLLAPLAPLAVLLGPAALRLAAGSGATGQQQEAVGRYLILLFLPQLFLYAVVGTATAVMNAGRRFALAAAAPALENLGTIAVLLACAASYGTGHDLASVPDGELLLLGLGTTGSVALHAFAQWWGAKRVGVLLRPRAGWRDAQVRAVMTRARPSVAQAGLSALQVIVLLVLADRIPGGVLAFQIALNFYYLAIALGATPVALSLLPRLSRMNSDRGFRDALTGGWALGLFLAIPAATALVGLARPLARAVAFGHMGASGAITLIAVAVAALGPGVIAQTAFLIGTYACYARLDTRSPMRAMLVQAAACLLLTPISLAQHGAAVPLTLGLVYSASIAVGAARLAVGLVHRLPQGSIRIAGSVTRSAAGAALMIAPAWLVATALPHAVPQPLGSRAGIVLASLVGLAAYLASQAALRAREVRWLQSGLVHLVGRGARVAEGARDG